MKQHGSQSPAAADRLHEAAHAAREAEERGDDVAAGEGWRRYRLIRDANRDPDALLAEGIEFSALALSLVRGR